LWKTSFITLTQGGNVMKLHMGITYENSY
jgi:hypothetical protein